MKRFTNITFTQDKFNSKAVVADRYVPHDLYVLNKEIIEELGGEIVKGVGGFRAEFKNVASVKEFVAKGITHISEKEYKANRKVKETKPTDKPVSKSKGQKKLTRNGKGNDAPTKAVTKPARKSKGNAELTDAGKKALDKMKMSVLNRAAAAYDRANGGRGAVTFANVGKSEKELGKYMPKAKADLLASPKWKSAVDAYGLTEDMLG